MTTERSYPRPLEYAGRTATLRYMTGDDEAAVLKFARTLPTHDLLFLPRDITQPKVLAAWASEVERGALTTLLAVDGDEVIGCATLSSDPLSWSPHVGEVRVVSSPKVRGMGVGRTLTQEIFAVALGQGKKKLTAQMTIDQRGAIAVFEGLGFRGEALLRDHVQDHDGNMHDIVVLSHDVAQFQAQMEAYGFDQAFSGAH
ncbi:acetyltransferase GNAT family protein [Variibacter gotjawalensis]|uniref:Acetyltransferase GNAT family protein n=1 Tax=Variibacter gotjawalensis TaxID=1333996 RepID=A0A0S3PZJ8_9BRAD|nr:GNAT family N-acetyltransferase [Variibacter gotjawalensis]NIK47203.1 RimJ/RimL family protein N-acetyltransferase [Variibacter gotjawalensis]RZS49103.1 RimJ/RimL family protein N-acetyltransferase [Variibacter gotjawalensis]BAT61365.1 acetyltransferase GNAT family protein [Variibacter gotjawalensis]